VEPEVEEDAAGEDKTEKKEKTRFISRMVSTLKKTFFKKKVQKDEVVDD